MFFLEIFGLLKIYIYYQFIFISSSTGKKTETEILGNISVIRFRFQRFKSVFMPFFLIYVLILIM